MSIINVENLCFRYDSKGRQILNNVNLRLEEGEVMTILGPNGAGKSTLLNCIATLLEPESGTVKLCGNDTKTLKPKEVAKRWARFGRATRKQGRRITGSGRKDWPTGEIEGCFHKARVMARPP